jgi:hypothetical protein
MCQGTADNSSQLLDAGLFLANSHALGYNSYAPMARDLDLVGGGGGGAVTGRNVVLLGGVATNALTSRWHRLATAAGAAGAEGGGLGLLQPDGGIVLGGGRRYGGARVGVLMMAPHYGAAAAAAGRPQEAGQQQGPGARPAPNRRCTRGQRSGAVSCSDGGGTRALVLAATDSDGMADVMALATPTVPPMTRTPFANTVPDVVVTGPDSTWQGWGGMLAAAHLDHRWRAREELSWLA